MGRHTGMQSTYKLIRKRLSKQQGVNPSEVSGKRVLERTGLNPRAVSLSTLRNARPGFESKVKRETGLGNTSELDRTLKKMKRFNPRTDESPQRRKPKGPKQF